MLHPLFFLLLLSSTAQAQTTPLAAQEDRCIRLYSKLRSFAQTGNNDSLHYYSAQFKKEFGHFIRSHPATLHYPFQRFADSNFCYIRTSADGHFRIYSWDTWTGGTMHFFSQIHQWENGQGKVFSRIPEQEEGDAGGFCSKIYTVNVRNKPHYLVIGNGIGSTRDVSQSVSVYRIEDKQLTDTVQLFKTKTRRLSRIDVSFDFFSVVDRPERPLELITYDAQRRILYIPVVDQDGKVSNKNILYQLKGDCLEFIGIETGKRP